MSQSLDVAKYLFRLTETIWWLRYACPWAYECYALFGPIVSLEDKFNQNDDILANMCLWQSLENSSSIIQVILLIEFWHNFVDYKRLKALNCSPLLILSTTNFHLTVSIKIMIYFQHVRTERSCMLFFFYNLVKQFWFYKFRCIDSKLISDKKNYSCCWL